MEVQTTFKGQRNLAPLDAAAHLASFLWTRQSQWKKRDTVTGERVAFASMMSQQKTEVHKSWVLAFEMISAVRHTVRVQGKYFLLKGNPVRTQSAISMMEIALCVRTGCCVTMFEKRFDGWDEWVSWTSILRFDASTCTCSFFMRTGICKHVFAAQAVEKKI